MHRLIMTSAAYRQSSRFDPERTDSDTNHLLLSRFPLRRLDADAVRDTILNVAGRLETTPFGTPDPVEVRPDGEVVGEASEKGFRRSIYLAQRRSQPVSLLEAFDAPQLTPNCLKRPHSTVSSQALQLMNSDLVRESSRYLAGRAIDAAGDDGGYAPPYQGGGPRGSTCARRRGHAVHELSERCVQRYPQCGPVASRGRSPFGEAGRR